MDIKELEKPLNRDNVKGRKQAGFELSYIEGWWAISEANRIFGYDKWHRETIYCKEVSRVEVKVGKQQKDGFKVGYEAKVRVTVRHGVDGLMEELFREGTGHGSGISTDLFDCIEGAAKEAETDAMKRALMTFGNPFGLALYDKTQANVASEQQMALTEAIETHSATIEGIKQGIEQKRYDIAAEAWFELSKEEMASIWVAPSNGGPFTTEERAIMKSTEFREAHFGVQEE